MPITGLHQLTATTPDDPQYEIRPSHWNDAHVFSVNLSGSEISGAFSNAGNVTFGLETNGFITASANAAGAGDGFNRIVAGGSTAGTNQTVIFSNSNGVSFGLNGSTLTASHNGITSQSVQTQNMVSVLGSTGNISFANANGITFGANASTITASHNGLTTAAQSNHSHGVTLNLTNLSGTTGGNSNGITLSLSAAAVPSVTEYFSNTATTFNGTNISGSLTLNTNGLRVDLSVAPGGGGADGYNILAAGTQTAATNTTVAFVNGNGITFGMSGSSQITASHNGITQQSTQPVAVSAGNGSAAFSTLSFSNANGISFSTGAGPSIVASHNGLTSQSNQAFSASGGSSAFQTLNFANSNGLTFSNSNGSVIASYTAPTVTQYFSNTATTFNGTNVSGSITLNTNGLRIDLSAGAGGGVTPVASASNGSFSFTTLAFSNANNVTFGTSAGSIITASVAAPGAAAEQNAFNLLGANTSGNTTATGSTIGLSGINLTLSGTNASQIAISAPATSSLAGVGGISLSTNGSTISISAVGITRNYFNPQDGYVQIAGQQGQATMHIQPMYAPNVTFDRLAMPIVISNSSNSTGTVTMSFGVGIYTRTGSTFSLLSSTSASQAVTFSGTVNNSTFAGMRLLTIPWSGSLAEEQYYVGIWSRTTTGGTNCSVSQYLVSQVNSAFSGILGANSAATVQYTRGLGHYSATFSTAVPNSVGISQIQGSQSIALRQPAFYFVNGTF